MKPTWGAICLVVSGCSVALSLSRDPVGSSGVSAPPLQSRPAVPESGQVLDCSDLAFATAIDGTIVLGAAAFGAFLIRENSEATPEQRFEHGDVVELFGLGVEAIAAAFLASALHGHGQSSRCERLRKQGPLSPAWFCSTSSNALGHEARDTCSRELNVCQQLRPTTGSECFGASSAWCFSYDGASGLLVQCTPTVVACTFQHDQIVRASPASHVSKCVEHS